MSTQTHKLAKKGSKPACPPAPTRLLQPRVKRQTEPAGISPQVHEVINSPGQPLDPATRSVMESRFGHNFSQVRVHHDAQAAESARAVHAQAYTWGHHIAFARNRYQPLHSQGLRLLSHELAHVVQQDKIASGLPQSVAPISDIREAAADTAADNVSLGRTAKVAPGGPAQLALTRDSRLDSFLDDLPNFAHQMPASLTDEERAEQIISHFAGVNLRDPDNLAPISDAVAKYFPENTLFLFLKRIETDIRVATVAPEEERLQRQWEMLRVHRRGAWGTYTPFPVTEIVTRTLATGFERIGASAKAFFEGVIEGLGGPGSSELVAELSERLTSSIILNAIAPGVFAAGALVGIGRDFWNAIHGIWELITNFSEMMEQFGKLFDTILSPTGAAISRVMGRHVGQQFRGQLIEMANYNVFHFTYELGKLIGPTIVYAVLSLLGITIPGILAAVVADFAELLRKVPAIARIIESIGQLIRKVPGVPGRLTGAERRAAEGAKIVKRGATVVEEEKVVEKGARVAQKEEAIVKESQAAAQAGRTPTTPGKPAPAVAIKQSAGGVAVAVTEKEAEAVARLQNTLRAGGSWTDLSARDRRLLGNLFHKTVEPLSARIFEGVGTTYHNTEITADLIRRLRVSEGRVLFTEGKLNIGGRLQRVDLAEINFRTGHVTVLDLTSVERAEHLAKTSGYRNALQGLTGFSAEAMEMHYVGADASLLETLAEVAVP